MKEESLNALERGGWGGRSCASSRTLFSGLLPRRYLLSFSASSKMALELADAGYIGLRQISYWQAFGLLILAKLLFGRFSHPDHDRHDHVFKGGFFYRHEDRFGRRRRWGACGPGRVESGTEDVRERAPGSA